MSNEGAAQKTFDDAVGRLIKQGRLGLSNDGRCRYRLKEGNTTIKCVAGGLIPDDIYDSDWDEAGGNMFCFLGQDVHDCLTDMGYNVSTISDLQDIHDRIGNAGGKLNQFLWDAKTYADRTGLEWKFG